MYTTNFIGTNLLIPYLKNPRSTRILHETNDELTNFKADVS